MWILVFVEHVPTSGVCFFPKLIKRIFSIKMKNRTSQTLWWTTNYQIRCNRQLLLSSRKAAFKAWTLHQVGFTLHKATHLTPCTYHPDCCRMQSYSPALFSDSLVSVWPRSSNINAFKNMVSPAFSSLSLSSTGSSLLQLAGCLDSSGMVMPGRSWYKSASLSEPF